VFCLTGAVVVCFTGVFACFVKGELPTTLPFAGAGVVVFFWTIGDAVPVLFGPAFGAWTLQ